jgi:hypothetical protein
MGNSDLGIALANLVPASIADEYGWRYTPPLYSKVVTLLYVLLAVPLALTLAGVLGLFYVMSRARYAGIAYALACLMVLYAHIVAVLFGAWKDWMVHPLSGPFGGVLILMPVMVAVLLLAPLARRWR